jgi:hypothetical protein
MTYIVLADVALEHTGTGSMDKTASKAEPRKTLTVLRAAAKPEAANRCVYRVQQQYMVARSTSQP